MPMSCPCKTHKASQNIGGAKQLADNASDSGEDQQQYSPNFSPDLSEPTASSTSKTIQDRLVARVQEAEQARLLQCADQRPSTSALASSSQLFVPKVILDSKKTDSSMVARLLAIDQLSNQPKEIAYAEYAKFEAMEGHSSGSKLITIVYPFADTEDNITLINPQQNGYSKHGKSEEKRCAITIRVVNQAKISDLIGLSCHVYTRMAKMPPCSHPSSYSLYLAEDNYDYDTELPPQDRHRLVADCGFPVLAMVKNSEVLDYHQQEHHSVKVYLVNGKCFTYELESLDVPLKWLFQQAMASKANAEEQQQSKQQLGNRHAHLLRVALDYVLEPLDQRLDNTAQPLKLENTISSAGTTDFLLLRKNSSRGEFQHQPHKHGVLFREDSEFGENFSYNSMGGSKPATPGIASSSGRFDYQLVRSFDSPDDPTNMPSPVNPLVVGFGAILEEYVVDRLHRIKPKWPAKLCIREDCLEISPVQQPLQLRKKSFGAQKSGQKLSQIHWDFIGAAEVHHAERSNSRRLVRISVPTTRRHQTALLLTTSMEIGRLAASAANTPSDTSGNPGGTHWQMAQAYELSTWKTLQLEAREEEAWKIGLRLTEMLDSRHSQARAVYLASSGGAKKPGVAFEAVYGIALNCPTEPPSSLFDGLETGKLKLSQSANTLGKMARQLSSSTIAGKPRKESRKVTVKSSAGAVLSRMLSRQE
uniref:Target of rapamycin complex 2 subunit MAPKAP1 n=1 Tax=Ditylenchus dipsaci TaxID=166011 RepID=A0A915CRQ6_9BILA